MSLAHATTLLFVPGDRPDRFDRALAAGADVVLCDLEDAVAADAKDAARAHVADAAARGARVAVRVNAVGTAWHDADVSMAVEHGLPLVLPKADRAAVAALGEVTVEVLALVESARGLLDAAAVAALPQVTRLALGHLDLATDLGVAPDVDEVLDHARTTLVVASAAAGIVGPVDGVTPQLRDTGRLVADLARAERVGMRGKLCIHPGQVTTAADRFAPSPQELAWASTVVDAEHGGVAVVDGQMVDAPVLARAHQVLARGRRHTAPADPDLSTSDPTAPTEGAPT